MSTRRIQSQYDGFCATCRQAIPAGTWVSYTPRDGSRRSFIAHLECGEDTAPRTPPPWIRTRDEGSADDATRERIVRMADAEFNGFFGRPQRPARVANQRSVQGRSDEQRVHRTDEAQQEGNASTTAPRPAPENGTRQSTPPERPRLSSGFPVRRDARARHVGEIPATPPPPAPVTPPPVTPEPTGIEAIDIEAESTRRAAEHYGTVLIGNCLVPRNPLARSGIKAWAAAVEGCPTCERHGPGPSHTGSDMCRSHSIASGGNRAHCACDSCY